MSDPKVNLEQKFSQFDDQWSPKIAGEVNDAYVKLVAGNSKVAKGYVAYFGDIYLTNPQLLPDFDVVTMVHLCEFFFPNTASAEYGGIDDRGVLDLFTAPGDRRPDTGDVLGLFFYLTSGAATYAPEDLAGWLAEAGFERPRGVRIRRIPNQTLYEARRP